MDKGSQISALGAPEILYLFIMLSAAVIVFFLVRGILAFIKESK